MASRPVHTSSHFINPRTLVPCTTVPISQLIRQVVKWLRLGVYARVHDLRRFASVCKPFFIFPNMSLQQIEIQASGALIILPPVISLFMLDPPNHALPLVRFRCSAG